MDFRRLFLASVCSLFESFTTLTSICVGTNLYYSIVIKICLVLLESVLYSKDMPRLHTYSQHFLRSPRIVAELIGHSNVRKNDIVYDLGAGSGVIASVLANKCKK